MAHQSSPSKRRCRHLRRRGVQTLVVTCASVVLLAACAQEHDIIGLQRPVYTDEESVITIHYFALESEALSYYRELGAEEYFLFTAPVADAEEIFRELDGVPAPDGGKTLSFVADGDDTAIDQVLELIDEHGLVTIRSVHE
jgi:hypothetical protein